MASLFAAASVLCAIACGAMLPGLGRAIARPVLREIGESGLKENRELRTRQALLSIICAPALNVACLMAFGVTWTAEAAFLFCTALLLASLIDWEYHLLPDVVTLSLLWLGLLVNMPGTFVPPQEGIVGAVAGYVGLRAISIGLMAVTTQQGIGGGDFKLLAAIGAWLGWTALLPVALVSAGIAVARGLWVRYRRGGHARMAYGPGLTAGALIVFFYHACEVLK